EYAGGRRHGAEPIECAGAVAHTFRLQHLPLCDTLVEQPDGQAIFRCHLKQVVGRLHAGGTRHVDYDEGRVAWNVTAEMCGKQPPVEVVGPAGVRSDDEPHLPALVEVFHRVGECGGSHEQCAKPC